MHDPHVREKLRMEEKQQDSVGLQKQAAGHPAPAPAVAPAPAPAPSSYIYEEVTIPASTLLRHPALSSTDDQLQADEALLHEEEEDDSTGEAGETGEETHDVMALIAALKASANESSTSSSGSGGPGTAVQDGGTADARTASENEALQALTNVLTRLGLSSTAATLREEVSDSATHVSLSRLPAELQGLAVNELQQQIDRAHKLMEKTIANYSQLQRQRDYHRLHHRRVIQEKNILIRDVKRLRSVIDKHQPTIESLQMKLASVTKDKNLLRFERDRLKTKLEAAHANSATQSLSAPSEALQEQVPATRQRTAATVPATAVKVAAGSSINSATARRTSTVTEDTARQPKSSTSRINSTMTVLPNDSLLPTESSATVSISLLQAQQSQPIVPLSQFRCAASCSAHSAAVSNIAMHPSKPILATVSDDQSWKLWSATNGELLLSADSAHGDWLSCVDFHPAGQMIVTAGGDASIKMWDLLNASCAATFSEHTAAVWSVAVEPARGELVLSGSMDHTAKLWDLNSSRCRQTFRGHVDSVNAAVWLPASALFATASGDKTLSLWDTRAALHQRSSCVATFYGHTNAVMTANFDRAGTTLLSGDSDGVVRAWDLRQSSMCRQTYFDSNAPNPINVAKYDASAQQVITASDNGSIRIYSSQTGQCIGLLAEHRDAVHGLVLDASNTMMVTCSADQTFKVWTL